MFHVRERNSEYEWEINRMNVNKKPAVKAGDGQTSALSR